MEINIPERLHNCPNCGGTLQDDGACRFCGSKVYDFVSVDMESYRPTYLRIKHNDRIIIVPVRFNSVSTQWYPCESTLYYDDTPYIMKSIIRPTGTLDFTVVGDTIVEDIITGE